MKMRHFLVPILMTMTLVSSSFAQQSEDAPMIIEIPTQNPKLTLPVVVNTETEKESIKVDNYFKEMRQSLDSPAHGGRVTLQRFTKESASFFVAIAAVQMEGLLVEYSDNPRALQDHLETLTDPIGHLSFYMFMVANGYTTNFLSKRISTLDPVARAQAMRGISYKGMAAGSVASSLTAELLTTMKDCAKIIFAKDKNAKTESLAVCDSALKQWTLSGKTQQYIPQIMSLIVSTDAAQIVEVNGRKLMAAVSKTALAKGLSGLSGRALEVTGIQVLMAAAPVGWAPKGIQIVGKVAQFAGFTYIDHKVSPLIHKGFANLWKPASFDFDAASFNDSVFYAKQQAWKNDAANTKLAEKLTDIKQAMAEWRQSQLTEFYTSHSIWSDNLMKIIDQTQGTFSFYKTYLDSLFSTLNVDNAIRTGELPPAAMNNESYYPFRLLPLFGVRLLEALPEDYESENDLYLTKPIDLENHQMKTIIAVNAQLKAITASRKMHENDVAVFKEITTALDSKDRQVVGTGLAKINDVVIYNKTFVADPQMKDLLIKVRKALGNPYPILTPGMGFTYAYEMNSFTESAMKAFKRSSAADPGPGKWLTRTSDYLLVQMACGSEKEVYKQTWGFAPTFVPPKIVNKNLNVSLLCSSLDLRNLHSMKLSTGDGRTYTGINELIYKNLRADVFGDYRKADDKTVFSHWWNANVNAQLGGLYKGFDVEYVHVLAKLTENWEGYRLKQNCTSKVGKCLGGILNKGLDQLNQSDYLDKNVLQNLRFELDIYTSVLNELLLDVSQDGNSKSTANLAAQKDSGGFLRRIKAGDYSILKDQKVSEIAEITQLKTVVRDRLNMLAETSVDTRLGVVNNMPDKAVTKKAIADVNEAFKQLSDKCKAVFVTEKNEMKLSPTQKKVFENAVTGVQSVIAEASSLNMALYTTKYKLEDSYNDILSILKSSQDETKAKAPKAFSPTGK